MARKGSRNTSLTKIFCANERVYVSQARLVWKAGGEMAFVSKEMWDLFKPFWPERPENCVAQKKSEQKTFSAVIVAELFMYQARPRLLSTN